MTDKQKQKLNELLALQEAEERDLRDFLKRCRKNRELVLKHLGVVDVQKEEQNNNTDYRMKYDNLKSSVDDLLSMIYTNYDFNTEEVLNKYVLYRKQIEEEKNKKNSNYNGNN